jgi:CubicO group peptidase (beta-lactamase class C family)
MAAQAHAEQEFLDPVMQCLAARADRDAFSGVVAINEQGRAVFRAAYGRRAPDLVNDLDTPFNVGSMSKMFTAVAIGQLVDRDLLHFDDALVAHMDRLPDDIAHVTVRQLLTHTSGMGDYFRPENRAAISAARRARDLLPIALADGLGFAPGSRRSYSNSGYVVLGALVETISGRSFADYIETEILHPTGMISTRLDGGGEPAQAWTRRIMGSTEIAPDWRPAPGLGPGRASPAGGAYSTADDLARFGEALLNDRLITPATRAALWTMQGEGSPSGFGLSGYGLGFNIFEASGQRVYGHGGGSLGVNAQFDIYPAQARVVVILSNFDPPAATVVNSAIRQFFLDPAHFAIADCASA